MECMNAYELITPVSQVPGSDATQVGIAKDAVATPIDVNASATPVFFSLVGARVSFFDHMVSSDRDVYERLKRMAHALSNIWSTQRASVITLR